MSGWRSASGTRVRGLAVALVTALGVTGCGIFGGGDDDELEPTPLADFEQSLGVRRAWTARIGKGTEFLRLSLMPAGDGARIFAASYDGAVVALNAENGRRDWRVSLDTELTAGPGFGDELLVVISRDGEAICLQADNGAVVWRSDVGGESVSVPVIGNGVVVVQTIDGLLRGLSAQDGSVQWTIEHAAPALTLRGSSAPVIVGSSVISGFDNGRLVAASLLDGTTEWEAMLSPPSGRSDLERLADIDGALAVVGQDVYAAGYQGRIAALASESGQVLWSRELSTYAGISAEWDKVYALSAEGELVALQRRNGTDAWRQSALVRREPTTPVPFNTAVVAGDFEGYLHFFDTATGNTVARTRVGKGLVSGMPVVIANRLFVQSESGEVAAFEVPQPEPEPEPEPVAEEDAG